MHDEIDIEVLLQIFPLARAEILCDGLHDALVLTTSKRGIIRDAHSHEEQLSLQLGANCFDGLRQEAFQLCCVFVRQRFRYYLDRLVWVC